MKNIFLMIGAMPMALVMPGLVWAQAPTGAISGFVADATGARIRAAIVVVIGKETGMKRTILASGAGEFVVPALVPGVYEVTADASGFKQIVREATIEA